MPRKKIYDIKPPKVKQAEKKLEKNIKEFFDGPLGHSRTGEAKSAPKTRKRPAAKAPVAAAAPARIAAEKRSLKRPLMIGGGVALVGLCVYLFFALPRVEVIIKPVLADASYQRTVTASTASAMVDAVKLEIPAKQFTAEETLSQQFPATGNATNEGKATGTITIFNKADPVTPLTLKAGTRFIADSGYVFVTLQKVVIPAGKKSGGKVTPGSITVQVEAAEGGEAYNIPASSFSVPGLKGTSYYFTIYASSAKPMAGGYASTTKKITDNDIQLAKDALEEQLVLAATGSLKESIPDDYILLDGAITARATIQDGQVKAGTVAQDFALEGSLKASAIAFKKSDLDEFVKSVLIAGSANEMTVLDSSISQEYSLFDMDAEKGVLRLGVDISAKTYQGINDNSLALAVFGQDESHIKQTVGLLLGDSFETVEVKFWPFWVSSAPNSQKAVRITLKFN